MSQTNILTGLNVTSQSPLDPKTTVTTLSVLTNYGVYNEKVYTYYKNMQALVMDSGLYYVWRETDTTETPVSEVFTYPVGHIVDNINYSNKSYAFYLKKESEVIPPDTDKISYRTRLINMDYNLEGETDTQGTLYSGDNETVEGDYTYENIRIRPVASRTLQVFNPPNNVGWGGSANTAVPLRIEMYPPSSITISPDPDQGSNYENLEDVIDAVASGQIEEPSNIVFLPSPGRSHNIPSTSSGISWNTTILIPSGVTIDANGPILRSDFGVIQNINMEVNSNINANSPIILPATGSKIKISGKGTLLSNSGTSLISKAAIAGFSVNSNNDTSIDISGIDLILNNGNLIDTENAITLDDMNVEINFSNSSIIESNGADVQLKNIRVNTLSNSNSIVNVNTSSNVHLNNIDTNGNLKAIVNINSFELDDSVIDITNSDFRKSNINSIISVDKPVIGSIKENYLINNTMFNKTSEKDSSFDFTKTFNSSTQTSNIETPLEFHPDRSTASLFLNRYSLFINTNKSTDESDYFVDVVL